MWLHQGIFLLKALNNTVENLVDSPSYCFCASTPSLVRPLLAPFVVVFKQRLPTWMDGSHDSPRYCFGSSFLAPSVANDWDSWLLTSLDASLYSSFSAVIKLRRCLLFLQIKFSFELVGYEKLLTKHI